MIFHSKCQGNIAISAQGVHMGVEGVHTVLAIRPYSAYGTQHKGHFLFSFPALGISYHGLVDDGSWSEYVYIHFLDRSSDIHHS